MSLVALRDRHHEPEVRVDHRVLGLLISALDALRELDLLRGGEERITTRLVEEELERIGRRMREVAVDIGGALLLRPAAIVREHDVPLVELGVESLELVVLELDVLQGRTELGEVEATCFFPGFEQGSERLATHSPILPEIESA